MHSPATRLIWLVIAVSFTEWSGKSIQGQETLSLTKTWDFGGDQLQTAPAGFRAAQGAWTVEQDGTNHVLSQTAKNHDLVFNVILRTDVLFADVDLSVRLKANAGTTDQGGGLVWRAKNAKTYYVARYNPLEDSIRLYKVVDGKRTQLGSVKVPGDTDWHALRITMRGEQIQCFFDGKVLIEVADPSIRGFGRVGLWSKADAQSFFDDLAVKGEAIVVSPPAPLAETKEFEIKNDRAFLGGHDVDLWGLRCGNAFFSDAVTERYIRNLDNMNAHGINLVGAYLQGTNAGFPDADAGSDGFTRDGKLLPEVARRVEWFVREADQRGMVVMIGVLTPRKDQMFYDDAALRRAIENTGKFLVEKKLNNVFVDLCHEFNHALRIDTPLLREPDGSQKKEKITAWFKAVAPRIEAGITPTWKTDTADHYPNMDVRLIQKKMPIPESGFVVNVEPFREDYYNNDGIFNSANLDAVFTNCRNYLDAPNAAFMFHSGFLQGITNFSGTAPHAEMGGYGTGPNDRGIRFYYDWVRDNVGKWDYPRHVPAVEFSIDSQEP